MFCQFDCLTDGITTFFIFNHIPSHLAVVKCGRTHFQFCAYAAIYPRLGCYSHSGNNIPYTLPDELSHRVRVNVNVILWGYPEHIPVCLIKTTLKSVFRLVRPVLNIPYYGYFLFEFLPIGREEQSGVVVRFSERRAGDLITTPFCFSVPIGKNSNRKYPC